MARTEQTHFTRLFGAALEREKAADPSRPSVARDFDREDYQTILGLGEVEAARIVNSMVSRGDLEPTQASMDGTFPHITLAYPAIYRHMMATDPRNFTALEEQVLLRIWTALQRVPGDVASYVVDRDLDASRMLVEAIIHHHGADLASRWDGAGFLVTGMSPRIESRVSKNRR